ncbi:MAG TPA: hypothetical protein VM940_13565 [Chthoniobacterales bacterium]|nr:hypothetical protein [Chthoniobacterales bacterium]
MKRIALSLYCVAVATSAFAQSVSVQNGNIQYTDKSGATTALTSSGRDSNPILAPDGKWVAFVRKIDGNKIASGADESDPSELWQVGIDGKQPTMLIRCREAAKPESLIAGFDSLQFSTNGKLLYFVTPAWATSGAIHVVDTTNRKERYLFPGSELKVVPAGEYKDCLLVQQHRYFIGGGSYDWFWLFRPDGKEVGPVGETTEVFDSTYNNE